MHHAVRISSAPAAKGRKPAPLIDESLARFKGFARKLALSSPGNNGGVLLEWAASVGDLHRVLDVTRSLYLLNQTHNEVLLRVGIELATAKTARRIFEWVDGDWYGDDERREWFRDTVQSHLTHVLEVCAGERKDDDKLATANAKVREVQAELAVALQKCEAADAMVAQTRCRIRNLEHDYEAKSEDLFQTQAQLEEAKVQRKSAWESVSALEAKLRETRKTAAAAEANLRDADARALLLEDDLAKQKAEIDCLRMQAGSWSKEVERLRAESDSMSDKKESAAQLHAELRKASQATAEASLRAQRKSEGDLQRQAAELQTWVDAAETAKSQASELRAVVQQLQEKVTMLESDNDASADASVKIAELQESLVDMKGRFASLDTENNNLRGQLEKVLVLQPQTMSNALAEDIADVQSPGMVSVRPHTDDVGMQTEKEKTPRKTGSSSTGTESMPAASVPVASPELKSALSETRKTLKRLESENQQLKITLDNLQSKLKSVVESCQGTGVASQLSDVISKLGLKYIKIDVWDRLYGDAMERVERVDHRNVCSTPPKLSAARLEDRRTLADEHAPKGVSKTLLTHVSSHAEPTRCVNLSHDFHCVGHSNLLETAIPSHTARSAGGWPHKSLSLPPCSTAQRLPSRCSSSYGHLRSMRQPSRGKALGKTSAARNHDMNFANDDDLPSPPKSQRRQIHTSLSLPSLHGQRLQTQ